MAESVDIDAAFESLVGREQAAIAAIQQQLPALRPGLSKLAATPFFAAFGAAISARQELVVSAGEWVQYAVDENVMGALAEKIGNVFGACSGAASPGGGSCSEWRWRLLQGARARCHSGRAASAGGGRLPVIRAMAARHNRGPRPAHLRHSRAHLVRLQTPSRRTCPRWARRCARRTPWRHGSPRSCRRWRRAASRLTTS
jgi:hypothetical protein